MPVSEEVAFNIRARDNASRVMDRVGGKLGVLRKEGLAVGAGFAAMTIGLNLLQRAFSTMQQWLGDSIKKFREFERSMSEVETMLDEYNEQLLPEMTSGIENLSIVFGKSATDLSRGLYQILSAGIEASQAMDVLKKSTKLATATLTDVETAVDAVTTVLNAYSMNANQAEYVTNIMAKTIQLGKLRMDELAHAIGYVAPIAAAAGISFEEVAASLATLTKVGQDANMAARGLRQVINNLISPSEEAQTAMVTLGVSFDDLLLEGQGLEGSLNKIQKATAGNISEISEMIPNVRALTAALGLMTDNGNLMSHSLEYINNEFQALNEMFTDVSQSSDFLRKKQEMLGETIDRDVGEKLEGAARTWKDFQNIMALTGKNIIEMFGGNVTKIPLVHAILEYKETLEEAGQKTDEAFDKNAIEQIIPYFERVKTEIDSMNNLYDRMTKRMVIYRAQLEQLYEKQGIVQQTHDYKEALHYIPLALEDAAYTTKIFDETTQALVDSIRMQRNEIERLNRINQKYSMRTLSNNIKIAKIQLAADKRRGRMTRNEQEQLNKLERANRQYQIKQMQNQLKTEQIKQNGLNSEEKRLEKIKTFYQEEIRNIENTHEQELESLNLTIQSKELLLEEYKKYIGDKDTPGTLLGDMALAWERYYAELGKLPEEYQTGVSAAVGSPQKNVNITANVTVTVTDGRKNSTDDIIKKISEGVKRGIISGVETKYG